MANNERYGLKAAAFTATADPAFYIKNDIQLRALSHLRRGLKQGEGIVIITGDSGVGKTAVLDQFQRETRQPHRQIMMLDAVSLKGVDLANALLSALGGDPTAEGADDHIDVLRAHRDEKSISYSVVIDNAEALSDEGLEQVRKLANLYHDGEALLQINLAGATPLRSVLYRDGMDRFRQKVIASYHMPALNNDQVAEYIRGRLHAAGAQREDIFTSEAIFAIAKASSGIPGQINQIASHAMAAAAAADHNQVLAADVSGEIAPATDRATPKDKSKAADKASDPVPATKAPELQQAQTPKASVVTGPATTVAPDAAVKPVPADIKSTNPIYRINGHTTAVMPALAKSSRMSEGKSPKTAAVSVSEINQAIQRISEDMPETTTPKPAAPAKPQKPARRGLSPHELMMERRSPLSNPTQKVPVPTAKKADPRKPQPAQKASQTAAAKEVPVMPTKAMPAPLALKALSKAPKPQGDLWDPSAPMSEQEAKILDALPLTSAQSSGKKPPSEIAKELDRFLEDTRAKLDSLRTSLKTLRHETDRLDTTRRENREKISDRIDGLQKRLESLRGE